MINTAEDYGLIDSAEQAERQKAEAQQRWEAGGGSILEADADGIPLRWSCGRDAKQALVDPPGVEFVTHYLNSAGEMEGKVETDQDIQERDGWRDAA